MAKKKYFSKEEELAARRQKYHENRHKLLPIYKERYEKNKKEILRKMKERYDNNHEFRKRKLLKNKEHRPTPEYKARRNMLERKKLQLYRDKVFQILGGYVCKKCKYAEDKRALQIDHVNGGGGKERRRGYTYVTWKHYANNPELTKEKFQVLCCNCNILKRYTNNEF